MIPDPLLDLLREVLAREDCPAPYRHCIAEYLATGDDLVLSIQGMAYAFGNPASSAFVQGPWFDFANSVYMGAPGTSAPRYMTSEFTEDQATNARKLLPPIPSNDPPA